MKKISAVFLVIMCGFIIWGTTVLADGLQRPVVLTTKEGMEAAIERTETDETVAKWYNTVKKKADNLLETDLVPENTSASADAMDEARTIKGRILSLGFVYYKTGNEEYAKRACREVLNACTFDWKSKTSPLGMAEMAFVVALGYDWLYDCYSDEELALIENALMEKAIIPYYNYMMEEVWWGTVESNWNIVCNGGVLSAIIALDGKAGALGDEAFAIGLENINSMMPLFGPDGAWEEGLMYWRFTTEYFANFMSTLINYAGTDFGYCEWDGVDEIGYYPYYMTGAKNGFSYSDCIVRHENPPQVFWFATYFGDTALAGLRINDMKKYKLGGEVRDILWYNGEKSEPVLEKDKSFGRVEAFCMRDTYENTDGVFLAGKGGQIGISHSHFDAGSFVLEALGERFVQDLGWEDYSNPVEDRYQLYRNRAEGHNTLVINPSAGYDQVRDTVSKIAAFESGENSAYAVLDLTPVYKDAIDIKRGFYFDRTRNAVLLQDEIILDKESDIWWFAHTAADIALSEDGKAAALKIGEKQLDVKILGSNDYTFAVMDAKPFDTSLAVEEQNQNEGIKKLAINTNNVHNAIIRVSFTPEGSQEGAFREEVPVDCWSLTEGLFITEYQKSVAPGESFDFDAKLIDKEEVRDAMLAQWSLVKAHNGVSIDASTGVLKVAETASPNDVDIDALFEKIQSLVENNYNGWAKNYHDRNKIVIILTSETGEVDYTRISRLHMEIKDITQEKITMGVGEICFGIEDIPNSYMQASTALDYRVIKGADKVIFHDEIGHNDDSFDEYPHKEIKTLNYKLKEGDVEEIEAVLADIIDYVITCNVSLFIARGLCFDLINTICEAVSELNQEFIIPQKYYINVDHITKYETVGELMESVRNICTNLCALIKENKSAKHDNLLSELIDFIDKNYRDVNFSVQAMADEFGLSMTNLSQYFKNHTGNTVNEYITGLRIKKAQELLVTTNKNLTEITKEVGYVNTSSFIRRFKQMTGVTPGQYSKMNKS